MDLWRIARSPFAGLDGEGAQRFGGRWNSIGRPVVYLAEHPALAVLEVLAHLDLPLELAPDDYLILKFKAANEVAVLNAQTSPMSPDTKAIGDAWLASNQSALLRVPSVLAPESWNYLLNPIHPAAQAIAETARYPFGFDMRLLEA